MTHEEHSELPARWRGSKEGPRAVSKQPGKERREATRYPLAMGLRYSLLRVHEGVPATGSGHTIDVSSLGMRFTAQGPLAPGLPVQLLLDWPLVLHDGVPLQLITFGVVVRSNRTETAVQIQRHEFRTRRRGLA